MENNIEIALHKMENDLSFSEIDIFEKEAKQWVDLFYNTHCSTDVTPYMHILAFHVPESMRLHGNVSHFCQQGLEKLNDLVTKWYHRSTNFGSSALAQILAKQYRLHKLQGQFKRKPKWTHSLVYCFYIQSFSLTK